MTLALAVLEQRDGVLRKISHEVVTGSQRLSRGVDAVLCAAGPVQGADQLGKFALRQAGLGAKRGILFKNAAAIEVRAGDRRARQARWLSRRAICRERDR